MTLLTPGAAILAASLAMPALAILYLLKLRRRPLRVTSTVLWEQAAQDLQVNTPFRWMRWSLLLLLHLLIVGLFCLALGRPAVGDSGMAARRVVLVIDRSASMSAKDGVDESGAAVTRLEQAKIEARKLLAEMGRGFGDTGAGLVTFAAEPKAVVGMTPDLRLVRDEVAKVEPTDQPGDLQAAMKLVVSMVSPDGVERDAGNTPLVVILGDGGYPADVPLSAGDAEIRFVRCGPKVGASKLPNVGVTAMSARRDDTQPSTLRVFARVVNSGTDAASAAVTLAFSGEIVERRAVTIPATVRGPTSDGLAGVGVTFELTKPQAGIVTVSVSAGSTGTPDLLLSDDVASVVVAPALRPAVLFVTPGAGVGGGSGVTPEGLLGDVLAELPLEKLERVTPARFDAMTKEGSLTGYDLLVVDRADLQVAPAIPTLALGASMPSAGLVLGQASDGPAAGYILSWKRTHPVLRDVAMDTVYVGRTRPYAAVEPQAASSAKLDELARGGSSGAPLMRVSEEGGTRRLSVAFEVSQSNWALEPGFAIFLSSAVEFLTGRNAESAAVSYTTGSRIEVLAPETTPPAMELELAGPQAVRVGLAAGTRRVMVGPLERAGVYTTRGAPPVLAVNVVDERESGIETADEVVVAGRSVTSGTGAGGPTEVWPWAVMLGGALLAVEWLVYGLRSRV